jgi:predicted NAD/FAD-binding protein
MKLKVEVSVDLKNVPKELQDNNKAIQYLAQNIISRYFYEEYFSPNDIDALIAESKGTGIKEVKDE